MVNEKIGIFIIGFMAGICIATLIYLLASVRKEK